MIKELTASPYAADCPSRQLLDRIGDKWTVLVMISLADGPKRYTQLAKHIERVSQKMLTQTLRALERDGMVTRTVYASVPPQVDYELTPLGRSLLGPITALRSGPRRICPTSLRPAAPMTPGWPRRRAKGGAVPSRPADHVRCSAGSRHYRRSGQVPRWPEG